MRLVPSLDLRGKRVLIFIVAYNAETTIEKVLSRIPASLHQEGVEVLIIDDFSRTRLSSTACATSSAFCFQDHRPAYAGKPRLRREPETRLSLRDR